MITIIDYGIGNLRSMEKALQHVGVEVRRTDDPQAIANAERLVLPGVGAYGACIKEIKHRNLVGAILRAVDAGTPLLGVCVGMQLLFDYGEEKGHYEGLGLLPGKVIRLDADSAFKSASAQTSSADGELKIPHMGWNTVSLRSENALVRDIPEEPYFYFVHSYRAVPENEDDVLGETTYGSAFPSMVHRENIYGVQFHPEKSQSNGLHILKNFATEVN